MFIAKKEKVELGAQFGKWTVLRFIGRNSHGHETFECKCGCGCVRKITSHSLTAKQTTQCRRCYIRSKVRREYINNACKGGF